MEQNNRNFSQKIFSAKISLTNLVFSVHSKLFFSANRTPSSFFTKETNSTTEFFPLSLTVPLSNEAFDSSTRIQTVDSRHPFIVSYSRQLRNATSAIQFTQTILVPLVLTDNFVSSI